MTLNTPNGLTKVELSFSNTGGVVSVRVTPPDAATCPEPVEPREPEAVRPPADEADGDLDVVASWPLRYPEWVEYFERKLPDALLGAIESRDDPDSRYSPYMVLGYNADGKINLYNQTSRPDGVRGMRNCVRQSETDEETLGKLRVLYYLATRVYGVPVVYGEGYQAKAVDARDNVYRLIDPSTFESDDFRIGDV